MPRWLNSCFLSYKHKKFSIATVTNESKYALPKLAQHRKVNPCIRVIPHLMSGRSGWDLCGERKKVGACIMKFKLTQNTEKDSGQRTMMLFSFIFCFIYWDTGSIPFTAVQAMEWNRCWTTVLSKPLGPVHPAFTMSECDLALAAGSALMGGDHWQPPEKVTRNWQCTEHMNNTFFG